MTKQHTAAEKEAFLALWEDIIQMYRDGSYFADNGVPFMDRIDQFIDEIKKLQEPKG